jgi:hypothetical protein
VELEGAALAKLVHDRLITHQTVLSSLAHFVEANPDFSYKQFELFTKAALKDSQDVFALSFNDAVARDQLLTYEAKVNQNTTLKGFRAVERNAQRQLVPVAPLVCCGRGRRTGHAQRACWLCGGGAQGR